LMHNRHVHRRARAMSAKKRHEAAYSHDMRAEAGWAHG
jgi:hypothetical protein